MRKIHLAFWPAIALIAASLVSHAQDTLPEGAKGLDLPTFWAYDPPSTLVVPETEVSRAKYPFVDVHNHQWRMATEPVNATVEDMDALNMAVMVNLSGRGGRRIELPDGSFRFGTGTPEHLEQVIANARKNAPGRFVVFTNVDFDGFGEADWTGRSVAQLRADVAAGAVGLKIYKSLGMDVRDESGARVATDDPRLDPIWAACGELGIPVLIHTADPAPFWQGRNDQNERFFELIERPERYRDPETNPQWETLIAEQHAVFGKHPETTFINAHFGWLANDLGRLGELLDAHPNVMVEFGAIIAELGRQPRFAKQFFVRYQDRILFGKDSWRPEEYPTYFRLLESADEHFPYFRRRHAFWRINGLDLPDQVLRKIYYENALRVIPGIERSRFPGASTD